MKILAKTVDGEELELEVEVNSDKEIAEVKLKNDWTVVGDHLKYSPEIYVEHAKKFLYQKPPDLKQAAEKIWGLMAHLIKNFYLQIGIGIKSHRAIRALAMFMFKFVERNKIIKMSNCFNDAEDCHRRFYSNCLIKSDIIRILDNMQDFMTIFAKISKDEVKEELDLFISGAVSKEYELESIEFCVYDSVEKFEGKDYIINIIAN